MKSNVLLEACNISKSFPGVKALDDVSIQIERGEVHALIGENGAGKSTLIKILGGIYHHDNGKIVVDRNDVNIKSAREAINLGISIIHQELNLADNMTVAENIFFGRIPTNKLGIVKKKELEIKTKDILSRVGLNIDVDTKVRYLSIAQKQMLEIGKSLSLNARLIIMDEPTSSLSPTEIKLLFNIIRGLKNQGVSIIYISHKMEEIFEVCDRATVLRDGQLIGTINAKDTTKEQLINMMVGREVNIVYDREKSYNNETILEVKNISNEKLKDISFDVKKGEIIGFSGLMGAGKSEIARALFGIDTITSGEILLNEVKCNKLLPHLNVCQGMGYIPEDRKLDGLFLNLTVKENMSIASINSFKKGIMIKKALEKDQVMNNVEKLSIKTPSIKKKIRDLSGGNQQKVIIARWLLKKGLKLLIIDEPTRGIDVGAKFEIYEILSKLAEKGISVLVMSSEIEELLNISDRIIVLREGTITAILDGKNTGQTEIMKYSVY